jgi:RNA 3'-terminal phosphate cyclase-like protein
VDDIRVDDAAPGLRDYEASLLRLLEKVTNGTVVEINETGALRVTVAHACGAVAHACVRRRGARVRIAAR